MRFSVGTGIWEIRVYGFYGMEENMLTKTHRLGLLGLTLIILSPLALAAPPATGETQEVSLGSTALSILRDAGSASEQSASPFIPPGHGSTPPGHGGTPPGQTTPPGHGGTPPGQGGTAPGHGGGPPPGHGQDPPGNDG